MHSTDHLTRLNPLGEAERIQYLWELDDVTLWSLYRSDCEEALVVLFRKYHRQIVVLVYKRMNDQRPVRMAEVQDAFGELVERILAGRYQQLRSAAAIFILIFPLSLLLMGAVQTGHEVAQSIHSGPYDLALGMKIAP